MFSAFATFIAAILSAIYCWYMYHALIMNVLIDG